MKDKAFIESLEYEEAKNLFKFYPEYKLFIKSYLITNDATPAIEIRLVRDKRGMKYTSYLMLIQLK